YLVGVQSDLAVSLKRVAVPGKLLAAVDVLQHPPIHIDRLRAIVGYFHVLVRLVGAFDPVVEDVVYGHIADRGGSATACSLGAGRGKSGQGRGSIWVNNGRR